MTDKTCFVISPIGNKGSAIRRQADCVLEYIIKPAVQAAGYAEPIRVDRLDNPTHITSEIVQHLVSSHMVIADLSGSNPNVFYELGIRHAFAKPCIMLSDWEPSPPFDVGGTNIIQYTYDDPTSHKEVIERIKGQIEKLGAGASVSNPVTLAQGVSALENSGDERDQVLATLSTQVEELTGRLRSLEVGALANAAATRLISEGRGRVGNLNYLLGTDELANHTEVKNSFLNALRSFGEPPSEGE